LHLRRVVKLPQSADHFSLAAWLPTVAPAHPRNRHRPSCWPLWSRTTKQAGRSSTDQGGGMRKEVPNWLGWICECDCVNCNANYAPREGAYCLGPVTDEALLADTGSRPERHAFLLRALLHPLFPHASARRGFLRFSVAPPRS